MTPIQISRLAGFGKKPPQVFSQSPVVLGTAAGCGVRFDPTWDKGVAAQHVRLEWRGNQWALCDLNSPGGTWIAGKPVTRPMPVVEPIEFELGRNGPRCRVELVTEAAAQAVPSFAPVAFPESASAPVRSEAFTASTAQAPVRKSSSGIGGPIIAVVVGVVLLAVAVAGWYFLRESYTVTPKATDSAGNLSPLPPRIEEVPLPPSNVSPAPNNQSSGGGGSPGPASANFTHATGLLAPNPQQLAWIQQNFPVASGVRMNALGSARLRDSGAYATGTAPAAVDMGDEIVTQTAGSTASAFANEAADPTPPTLPSAVDNSALPCFPGVGDQGDMGACAAFSSIYYSASHNIALVRGGGKGGLGNLKPNPLSPFYFYPLVNGGGDNGSLFQSVLLILQNHGAPTWQQYPYPVDDVDKVPPPENYRPWCTDPVIWRSAIHNRISQIGRFENLDTPEGLQKVKAFLANGYLVNYATNIYAWDPGWLPAKSDPSLSPAGNACAGQMVCSQVSLVPNPETGQLGGDAHAMTIVGYNDDIWVDINGDGKVEPGEKGAFKVVNSWGTKCNWPPGQDGGFGWISYDALRDHSAFPQVDLPNRKAGFWFKEAWYLLPQPDLSPHLLAQFTVSNAHRNEIDIRLGVSTTALNLPAKIWRPSAITITDLDKEVFEHNPAFQQDLMTTAMGGPFAFDGGDKEIPGTFVFDLDDLVASFTDPLPGNQYRFYLIVTDLKKDNPTTVSDFEITDGDGKMLAQAKDLPKQVDNDSIAIPLDCPNPVAPPPAPPPPTPQPPPNP